MAVLAEGSTSPPSLPEPECADRLGCTADDGMSFRDSSVHTASTQQQEPPAGTIKADVVVVPEQSMCIACLGSLTSNAAADATGATTITGNRLATLEALARKLRCAELDKAQLQQQLQSQSDKVGGIACSLIACSKASAASDAQPLCIVAVRCRRSRVADGRRGRGGGVAHAHAGASASRGQRARRLLPRRAA
jgi:hypothetical protein